MGLILFAVYKDKMLEEWRECLEDESMESNQFDDWISAHPYVANVSTTDESGWTALHYAVYNAHTDAVFALCKRAPELVSGKKKGMEMECLALVLFWRVFGTQLPY